MKATIGRIVHYKLSSHDVQAIMRRRTTSGKIHEGLKDGKWPEGAQAHIGNPASEGDVLPLVICRVWPNEFGQDVDGINGQVFLDANDVLWVTSIKEGNEPGQWAWPPRV